MAECQTIEAELAEEYFEKVKDASAGVDCEDGGNMAAKLWKMKRQLCPQQCLMMMTT